MNASHTTSADTICHTRNLISTSISISLCFLFTRLSTETMLRFVSRFLVSVRCKCINFFNSDFRNIRCKSIWRLSNSFWNLGGLSYARQTSFCLTMHCHMFLILDNILRSVICLLCAFSSRKNGTMLIFLCRSLIGFPS